MNRKCINGMFIAGMIVSWSVYYAMSKWMVGATGSAFTAGLLLRLAALVFLTIQLTAEKKLLNIFKQGRAALIMMLIGALGYALDAFANLGYGYSSLSTGTALLKTDVLMTNLATVIIYKKRLYASDWIGTVVMLTGVMLVLEIDFHLMHFNWYDLFFLASALCVTVNAFIIKSAQRRYDADMDMIAYYNNFVVLILFLVSTLVNGDLSAFKARADSLSGAVWGLAALGGLAQTCIYFFYYRNLKRCEVWIVKLYLLLMPVLSCIIGVQMFGEKLSVIKLTGIATVLLGAGFILVRDKMHPKTA